MVQRTVHRDGSEASAAQHCQHRELAALLYSAFLLLLLVIVVGLGVFAPTWVTSLVIGSVVLGFGCLLAFLRDGVLQDRSLWIDRAGSVLRSPSAMYAVARDLVRRPALMSRDGES